MDDDFNVLLETLDAYIKENFEAGREKALMLTKLEECWLWSIRAERRSDC